jgi:hypothetical protein
MLSRKKKKVSALLWQRLETLTQRCAAPGTDAEKAKLEFNLAETWAKSRGRLTIPGEQVQTTFAGYLYPSGEERQKNAQAAGYSAEAAAQELESRDELRHALRHYLLAANLAPKTELASRALRQANEALRLLAERTTWAAGRAFETDATATSRQCYGRLQRDFSGPNERPSENVWWTFLPPAEKPWTTASLRATSHDEEVAILQSFSDSAPPADPYEPWNDYGEWRKKIAEIGTHAGDWDSPRLIEKLAEIRRNFRTALTNAAGTSILNDLDDLTLFLKQPGSTPTARSAYFALRLNHANVAADIPELAPWPDFVAFLRLVRETGRQDPATMETEIRPMTTRMREFLQQYPKSVKREAAMARLAMAAVRESHGHAGVEDLMASDPPQLSGGQTLKLASAKPEEIPAARGALTAYAREFPNGRYTADLRLWRGVLAIDEPDWATALQNLTATLDDPKQPDLHLDAALNLGFAFLQLLDQPAERSAFIEALRKAPATQRRLWQFLNGDTPGARLRYLEGFLHEQLEDAKLSTH